MFLRLQGVRVGGGSIMSRKKEPEILETEADDFEELEQLEAAALEEDDAEEEKALEAPKKAARGRKKPAPPLPFAMKTVVEKAAEEEDSAGEEEEDLSVDEEAVTVVETEAKEKPARKSRRKPKTEKTAEETLVAAAPPVPSPALLVENSMDSLVKQFSAVKDNLERVVTVLHGVQPAGNPPTEAAPKVVIQKTSLANKITLAASFVAIVLSFLSLSLSQSARQANVEANVSKRNEAPSAEFSPAVPAPVRPVVNNVPRSLPQPRVEAKPELKLARHEKYRAPSARARTKPKGRHLTKRP
jgi:hypothetical protein